MFTRILIGVLIHFGIRHATALAPHFDRAETAIKKDVHDPVRRQEALETLAQMKTATTDFTKRREQSAKALKETLDRREVTDAELRAAGAPLQAEDMQLRNRLLDLQFQLRGILTAEEWTKVYPPPANPKAG